MSAEINVEAHLGKARENKGIRASESGVPNKGEKQPEVPLHMKFPTDTQPASMTSPATPLRLHEFRLVIFSSFLAEKSTGGVQNFRPPVMDLGTVAGRPKAIG